MPHIRNLTAMEKAYTTKPVRLSMYQFFHDDSNIRWQGRFANVKLMLSLVILLHFLLLPFFYFFHLLCQQMKL